MAYASPDDMIARYGVAEMIRLTTPSGEDMVAVNTAAIVLALGDADDLIDSYVSRRYQAPITTVPAVISRASCILARYDLCTGDGRDPSEQVRLQRKETIAWLEDIAAGRVLLPLDEVDAGDQSFAMMSDRGAVYGPGTDGLSYPSDQRPLAGYPAVDQGLSGSGGDLCDMDSLGCVRDDA